MNRINEINLKGRYKSRREFLQLAAGLGLSSLAADKVEGAEISRIEFKVLNKNTRIDIGNEGNEIIKKAYEIGHKYEKQHGGCARCTVAALQDAIPFIPKNEDVFRTACCLDGGATPTTMQNCGAFTGSGIIIGYLCGTNAFGNTGLSHKLINKVYEKFKEAYGSVLCRDVKKKAKSNCPEVVGKAVSWAAEILLKQFTQNLRLKNVKRK